MDVSSPKHGKEVENIVCMYVYIYIYVYIYMYIICLSLHIWLGHMVTLAFALHSTNCTTSEIIAELLAVAL